MILPGYVDFRNMFQGSGALAADGFPKFTVAEVGAAASPFFAFKPFQGISTVFPVDVDLAGADDAVPFVDEWHWYLSEPGMATGNPRFALERNDTSAVLSRSGACTITLTALGQSIVQTQNSSTMDRLLRDVHLYAIDTTTSPYHTVYWSPLHRCAFAPDSLSV